MLTLHILGSFAQFKRELLIERPKEGHLARLKNGEWSCGPALLGYKRMQGRLVEVPREAAVVRRIFRLYLQVRSLRAVAARLNEKGVRTRKGNGWSGVTVRQVLQNPTYTGANVYGRHRKGDTRLRPRKGWTVVPGMREPMVDRRTFEAVQRLLGKDKGRPVRERQRYPLSGLVRCGKCGSPMCGWRRQRGGKVYRYYRCNGYQHRGKGYCPGTSVRAEVLEAAVAARAVDGGLRRRAEDRAEPSASGTASNETPSTAPGAAYRGSWNCMRKDRSTRRRSGSGRQGWKPK